MIASRHGSHIHFSISIFFFFFFLPADSSTWEILSGYCFYFYFVYFLCTIVIYFHITFFEFLSGLPPLYFVFISIFFFFFFVTLIFLVVFLHSIFIFLLSIFVTLIQQSSSTLFSFFYYLFLSHIISLIHFAAGHSFLSIVYLNGFPPLYIYITSGFFHMLSHLSAAQINLFT